MISSNDEAVRTDEKWSPSGGEQGSEFTGAIRVWLVDDHDRFRGLLTQLLEGQPGIECVGEFDSAEAMLDALGCQAAPDVILMDVHMPGLGGLDAIRPIKSLVRSTHVLLLTTFYDSHAKARAIEEGASGFLLKRYTVERIAADIRQIAEPLAGRRVSLHPEPERVRGIGYVEPSRSDGTAGSNVQCPGDGPHLRAQS